MSERLTAEKRLAAIQAEIDAENKAKAELEANNRQEDKGENKGEEKSPEKIEAEKAASEKEAADKLAADEAAKNEPLAKSWEEILAEEKELEIAEKKKARLARLTESKMANLFLELEDEGKSIDEIADIAGKLKAFDTKDLTEEQLFMMIVSDEKGSDGQPLTDDEKANAYESFKELSPSVQKTALEAKRKEIEDKRKSEVERLTNDKKSTLTKVNECVPLVESKAKEIYGTEVNGVLMTVDLTKEFNKEALRQLVSCTDVKGDINAQKAISNALKIVLYDSIEAKAKEAGEKDGLHKAFKENHNPSEDGKIAKSQSAAQKTKEELEDKAARDFAASRNPFKKKVLQTN